jgi:hypothetical protein
MRVLCLIGIAKMPLFERITNLILLYRLLVMANLIFGISESKNQQNFLKY